MVLNDYFWIIVGSGSSYGGRRWNTGRFVRSPRRHPAGFPSSICNNTVFLSFFFHRLINRYTIQFFFKDFINGIFWCCMWIDVEEWRFEVTSGWSDRRVLSLARQSGSTGCWRRCQTADILSALSQLEFATSRSQSPAPGLHRSQQLPRPPPARRRHGNLSLLLLFIFLKFNCVRFEAVAEIGGMRRCGDPSSGCRMSGQHSKLHPRRRVRPQGHVITTHW